MRRLDTRQPTDDEYRAFFDKSRERAFKDRDEDTDYEAENLRRDNSRFQDFETRDEVYSYR